jgi:hypothetical protein
MSAGQQRDVRRGHRKAADTMSGHSPVRQYGYSSRLSRSGRCPPPHNSSDIRCRAGYVLLVGLGLLECGDCALVSRMPFLRHLGFERLDLRRWLIEVRSWRRHTQRTPAAEIDRPRRLQCFRHAYLAPGRLIDRQRNHRLFNLVLQHWLAPANLLHGQLASPLRPAPANRAWPA